MGNELNVCFFRMKNKFQQDITLFAKLPPASAWRVLDGSLNGC